MKKVIPLLALCLAVLLSTAVHAAEVKGLYRAEVPVAGQGAEEREGALRLALEEVLTKVTGYGGVAEEPEVADLVKDPTHLVLQYRYRDVPPDPDAPADAPTQLLVVSFDEEAVNEALRRHGLPIWGAARPTTLVWLAVEEAGRHRLIGANDEGGIGAIMRESARRRGLPLLLPLLDLQDRSQVQVADVWAGFQDTVVRASGRYQAQAVLIGRAYRDGGGQWHARWWLDQGQGNGAHWDTGGPDIAAALHDGVDGAADRLAARFAQTYRATGMASLDLRIDQVANLAAYARVMKYLRSLGGVKGVAVLEVQPQTITCQLALEVPAHTVVQTIALGSTLAPQEPMGAAPPGQDQTELTYRLVP